MRYKLEILGGTTGAIAGWMYWYFIGCSNGHCLISSNPLISTPYGALMGAIAFSMFKKQPVKQ